MRPEARGPDGRTDRRRAGSRGGTDVAASGLLARPRVERLLAGAWERRIACVVAGGGFGKTTALRTLAASGPSSWLPLTAADRDAAALSAHVAQALAGGGPEPAMGTASAIGATDRLGLAEGQAAGIAARLDAREEPLLLILDDVDVLEDDDSGTHFLSALCLQAPPQLHVVLSGRRMPALGLGSARGRGEIVECSATDLAFTRSETAALLHARLGPDAEALAEECWALTNGWAAALQLIADRLERIEPEGWGATVQELRRHHGSIWRDFAADLVDRESPAAAHGLAVAGIVGVVDPELLTGLGVQGASDELGNLEARGLLVSAGEPGKLSLSPVLSEVVAENVARAGLDDLRARAVAWLEGAGRIEEALECATAGPAPETAALLRRQGRALVTRGYGSRVAEILRELGTGDDLELESILAEALGAMGDWDGAVEVFQGIVRAHPGVPLPPATAWRYGALLYLRSENEAAEQVLAGAYREEGGTPDDALVSAWLSSVHWGRGEVSMAEETATVALRQAEATGDASARAAAHVAGALVAASRGDREHNERHYRLALAAAAQAGDFVQLSRIHANLSSRAAEEGDYAATIEQADKAIAAAAGHNLFGALAMSNKAEALMHRGELEEARALLVGAIEMFTSLGSMMVSAPYTQLGELDRWRGDMVRASVSLERAYRVAEQADDVHGLVAALAALAVTLGQDDPERARKYAADAIERASSLERAHALCARAWVELAAGERDAAVAFADQAEAEARRTSDRVALAKALELRGAAAEPHDHERLEAALALWREMGDPVAVLRSELVVAAVRRDRREVERLREEISRHGVRVDIGVAGLLLAAWQPVAEIEIRTLGRFAVLRAGQPIPLAAWQSRKARDLLKLLAARRGRPVMREAVAEALWPNEDPGPLSNRLSVALSTLRKVLDPEREHAPDHFIAADQQALALRADHVMLDVVAFLEAAEVGVGLASQASWEAAEAKLREAEALYTGDFLEEDVYEDWAVDCREEARSAAQEVSRLLARAAVRREDNEEVTRHLRRLLERDPYDADAWIALMAAQLRLRRYGEARRQHAVYTRRMAELAIAPVPLAQTVDARP